MGSVAAVAIVVAGRYALTAKSPATSSGPKRADGTFPVSHTDAQWRATLTPASYSVLREAATEKPFSSALLTEHRQGVFKCAGCAKPLFRSGTKFDSHTGWPSFWAAIAQSVIEHEDRSMTEVRTEVLCADCGGHLGHVFDDGPKPTGLRYCMNGVALTFIPAKA
ncbi:peptide-methionine (R)-S-oxide reductase MsrB [Novosphingobium sp. G106]|nr:peptide-methionine (R)-S-oxide reductase MsrB [Novosphingobium sp. G106]